MRVHSISWLIILTRIFKIQNPRHSDVSNVKKFSKENEHTFFYEENPFKKTCRLRHTLSCSLTDLCNRTWRVSFAIELPSWVKSSFDVSSITLVYFASFPNQGKYKRLLAYNTNKSWYERERKCKIGNKEQDTYLLVKWWRIPLNLIFLRDTYNLSK